jgi:serine protease Do
MKQLLFTAVVIVCTTLHFTAAAQDEKVEIQERKELKEKPEPKEKKETQEIIIRKKGDKDTRITVEIKGDKVTINGKPISEFKDGDITINKRDIKIWDGHNNFSFAPGDMEMYFNGPLKGRLNGMNGAFLGVTSSTNNDDAEDTKSDGAIITNVSKESAAEKAGLKNGDVITKINDKKIEDPSDLSEAINSFKPKDEVTVYYKRDGKDKSAKAILGENKNSMSYSFSGPNARLRSLTIPRAPRQPYLNQMPNIQMWDEGDMQHHFDNPGEMEGFDGIFPPHQKLGLKIQDTEEGDGVKVLETEKDLPAEKAGLQKDDIVTEIGGKKITNTDEAREQLHDNAEKSSYNIKAKRNGAVMSFDIKIPKKLKTTNL